MAAKKGGRLDASSLEQALEEAFNEDSGPSPTMVHGHETAGGVDAAFAGKLHEKLAQQDVEEPEQTGMKAPASTRMLTAADLAGLDDDDVEDEEGTKVVVEKNNHGFIDQVDSKLVTELNKKLSDEVAHGVRPVGGAPAPAAAASAGSVLAGDLSAALEKLGASQEACSCGNIFMADAQFCRKCGKKRASEACACGNVFAPDSLFCRKCGTQRSTNEEKGKPTFGADLSAALEKKLGGQEEAAGDDGFRAALERRFSDANNMETEANVSGLRAPQPTVKLSAQTLAGLDDEDDEVVDSALIVAQTHGAIESVDKDLVRELQMRLGAQGEGMDAAMASGFRAPMNTQKISNDMLPPDEDPDDREAVGSKSHGNIDRIDAGFVSQLQQALEGGGGGSNSEARLEVVERGCRAPQPTVKLSKDMLAGLADEDFLEDSADPLSVPAAAAAALNKLSGREGDAMDSFSPGGDDMEDANVGGMRAPQPTKLITADMLAGLDDDDDIEVGADPAAAAGMLQKGNAAAAPALSGGAKAKPKKGVSLCLGSGDGFDASFAASLQKSLQREGGDSSMPSAAKEAQVDPDEDGEGNGRYMSGLKAPATTQTLSAGQLAMLDDDDDDIPTGPDMHIGNNRATISGLALDDKVHSGMRAPQTTQIVTADQLAGIDDDDDAGPMMPSAAQLATLTAAAVALQDSMVPGGAMPDDAGSRQIVTVDSGFASKVVNTARDLPEATDMWGQPRPPTSSCKLRLAWLSKDEVRKENDQLRKEIASLRMEIDMHRKEATLARKM